MKQKIEERKKQILGNFFETLLEFDLIYVQNVYNFRIN